MINQPHQWAVGLDRTCILGLLKCLHFGRGQYATTCVNQLLTVTHIGDIWLDRPVPIIVELIAQIIGLPSQGMDPALILDDKSKEKVLAEEMKKKYGTTRGTRGIIIKGICWSHPCFSPRAIFNFSCSRSKVVFLFLPKL
jgi:hypothetical protein